jgi:hypothetical protein
MIGHYILDEHGEPRPEPDLLTWAQWFESDPRRVVAQTQVAGYLVSTMFFGIDHNFTGRGLPLLWESMIFSGGVIQPYDQLQTRYASKAAALQGHARLVQMLTS